jgi:GNAT-like C-terminal domain
LGVHVPRDGGRLTPDACDRSFACAREFFPRHFPEASSETARCTSWLLDPLRLRRERVAIDDLPQTTTLERAVVSHLKARHHWHTRRGAVSL